MIFLTRLAIWVAGVLVIAYFVLGYFGMEFNKNYFKESKAACEEKLKECGKNLVAEGTNNAQCDMQCVDPQLIVKKK